MTSREFEVSFRKLYLPLGMYALRIVENLDDAEDLVQDAFIKAWQAVENGEDIGNFRAYMYRCVRNGCISLIRRRKDFTGLDTVPDLCEEDYETSSMDARIWKAIDGLPERCREIFLMSKRDGLSNEEIAEELGISVKTVKNQMTKAFSRLHGDLSSGHKPFFLMFL